MKAPIVPESIHLKITFLRSNNKFQFFPVFTCPPLPPALPPSSIFMQKRSFSDRQYFYFHLPHGVVQLHQHCTSQPIAHPNEELTTLLVNCIAQQTVWWPWDTCVIQRDRCFSSVTMLNSIIGKSQVFCSNGARLFGWNFSRKCFERCVWLRCIIGSRQVSCRRCIRTPYPISN